MSDTPPPLPVLVINLARATERWINVQRTVEAVWGHDPGQVELVRMEATDGRELWKGQRLPPVTPAVELYVQDRIRVTDPLVLNTPGAIGASCSHIRCWEWLVDHQPATGCALILEDDVCFGETLREAAARIAATVRKGGADTEWDLIQLGWMGIPLGVLDAYQITKKTAPPLSTVTPWIHARTAVHLTACNLRVTTLERDSFGAHGYMLTIAGARRLLRHAWPLPGPPPTHPREPVHGTPRGPLHCHRGRTRPHPWVRLANQPGAPVHVPAAAGHSAPELVRRPPSGCGRSPVGGS